MIEQTNAVKMMEMMGSKERGKGNKISDRETKMKRQKVKERKVDETDK